MFSLVAFILLASAQEPGVALKEITLLGKADNAVYEVRLTIKVEKEARLWCRWVDDYGFAYEVDTPLKDADWNRVRTTILAAADLKSADCGISHAVNWSFRLATEDQDLKFTIRGEDHLEDARYRKLIAAMLEARDRCLAFAKRIKPAPIEPGRGMRRMGDGEARRLLLPSLARGRAASILADSTDCEGILPSGSFLNLEVMDALVALLDRDNPTKAAAACACLAWISGRPASDEFRAWKDWWKSERLKWAPTVEPEGTGIVGQGTVKVLAGGLSGFRDLELDSQGAVWGSADQIYALDAKTDLLKPIGSEAKVHAHYEPENRLDFLRRLAASGIRVDLRHDGLAVSGDGDKGVAVMAGLGVFDFAKRSWKRQVEGDFLNPVLNHDGSIVAVAEGRGWGNPNGVALFETAGGKRVGTPEIPMAETLFPIGWGEGAFYFFRDDKETDRDGDFEIWKHSVADNKSQRLMAHPKRSRYWVGVRTRIPVDSKGSRILVRKGTGSGTCVLGFLELATAKFSPVSADGDQVDRFEMSADARRVLFIRDGILFEWQAKP